MLGVRKPRRACLVCGIECHRPKSKFCGMPCRNEWFRANPEVHRAGAIGRTPANKQPIGTVKIRQRKNRTEAPRAWVKVAEPSVWKLRAICVWEQSRGPVPAGHIVHHEDRNTLNDDIANLSCVTRAEHLEEHRSEHQETRLRNLRNQNRKKK